MMRVQILVSGSGYAISEKSYPLLDSIVNFMNIQAEFGFEIGYHCGKHNKDEKQNLHHSETCSGTIIRYLTEKGISRDRLKYAGYGSLQPLITYEEIEAMPAEQRMEARHKNVRTEIKVVCICNPNFEVKLPKGYEGEDLQKGDIRIIDFFFGENIDDEYYIRAGDYEKTDVAKLQKWLRANPNVRIEINVYNDEPGDDKYNLERSIKKAQRVASDLVHVGVNKESVVANGYGKTRPTIDEKQISEMCFLKHKESARKINNRVEIKILRL